jgi:hypothetical protein
MAVKELKDSEKVLILRGFMSCLEAQNHDTELGKAISKIMVIAFPENSDEQKEDQA